MFWLNRKALCLGLFLTLCLVLMYVAESIPIHVAPSEKKCNIINSTYVDCTHCSLKSVPPNIPVSVETLLLSHNTIHLITSTSFRGLVNLTTLYLDYNSVSRLESEFFKDQHRLRYLSLHHNQLSKLPRDVFNNTPNIEFLDLSNMNQGFKTPPDALNALKLLRVLNLTKNQLKSASFGPDISLPSLQILNLGTNNIISLGKDDFVALRNCNILCLNFTGNAINAIDAGTFAPLNSLENIDFSNGIVPAAIPSISTALSSSHVQIIHLRRIGLLSWHDDNFQGFRNAPLHELDISFNDLTVLNSSFSGLSNLTNLVIRGNKIVNISSTAFLGLKMLDVLDLSGNAIKGVRSSMFTSLSNTRITKLYLNENKIAKLESPHTFSGLRNLKYLKLSKNKISQTLKDEIFDSLDSLEVLDLGENNVTLSSNAFKNLQNLQILYLNLNGIKEIMVTPSPFDGLKNLTKLDLSNNNMAFVHVDTFANLHNLETLYLQHNNLYNLWNESAHVPFLKSLNKLKYLDMCYNGFQNIPNNTLLKLSRLESLYLCRNKISHFEGQVFSGLNLRELDLSHNQINLINKTLLEPILPTLKTMHVADNPFSCSCDLRWFRNWLDKTTVNVIDLHQSFCASPPEMRGKPLGTFHPETLNCDHRLPLYAFILIGVGTASLLLIAGLVVRFRWYITYYYYLIRAKRKQYVLLEGEDRAFIYDAFVSFSHKDNEWIETQLLPNIESDNKFRLCIHERDFTLGRKIMDSIVEAIDSSRFTICVLSNNYLDSPWCKLEREFAMANLIHRDILIIILLGAIPKDKLTRYYKLHKVMKRRTYLQWPEEEGMKRAVFWQKLRDVLRDPELRVNNNSSI